MRRSLPSLPAFSDVRAWWHEAWELAPDGKPRQQRYVVAAVLGSVAIWALALGVMLFMPRSWSVEYSLIVPNGDPDARVNLQDVGQAYATKGSTYDSKSLDPRVNYREIILSKTVLATAASAVDLEPEKFGEPRIKLIDQASVMELKIGGKTPELALAKAEAVLNAFQARLDELRQDEIARRERAIEHAVRASREKLAAAQKQLLNFKVDSLIVTPRQLDEMALDSTNLQRKLVELGQRLAHDKATVTSLSTQLGMPARLAGWTLTLQGDAVFLEHFKQFAAASGLLSDYAHKWEDSHPKVREAAGQRDSAFAAMQNRARTVLSEAISVADLRRMAMVMQDRSRDQLLRELVEAQVSADSAVSEIAEVTRQRDRMSAQMPKLAAQSAELDELQRRVSFNEAVYTGAVGKTDVGLSNVFSSYPMIQTMVPPVLPERPAFPKTSYVGAGAIAATLLLTIGLWLAWLRNKQ